MSSMDNIILQNITRFYLIGISKQIDLSCHYCTNEFYASVSYLGDLYYYREAKYFKQKKTEYNYFRCVINLFYRCF